MASTRRAYAGRNTAPPQLGPDHQGRLRAPVVAQDDAVDAPGRQPPLDPAQTELDDAVTQREHLLALLVQVDEQLLHTAQEDHPLEHLPAIREDEVAMAIGIDLSDHLLNALCAGHGVRQAPGAERTPVRQRVLDGLAHVRRGAPQPTTAPVVEGHRAIGPTAAFRSGEGKRAAGAAGQQHVAGVPGV